jgi:hypothetical protein
MSDNQCIARSTCRHILASVDVSMKKASVYFGDFLSSPVPLPTYANVTHDAMYLKRQDGSSMRRAMQPDAV